MWWPEELTKKNLGDVIPISVTIEHIGVMVRDKALSIQLLRSVYYGKNK